MRKVLPGPAVDECVFSGLIKDFVLVGRLRLLSASRLVDKSRVIGRLVLIREVTLIEESTLALSTLTARDWPSCLLTTTLLRVVAENATLTGANLLMDSSAWMDWAKREAAARSATVCVMWIV